MKPLTNKGKRTKAKEFNFSKEGEEEIRKCLLSKIENVQLEGLEDPCMFWKGAKNNKGYGVLRRKGENFLVHRLSFVVLGGNKLKPGKEITHICNNPSCINPRHLIQDSHKKNMQYMFQQNRRKSAVGERVGCSKLTAEKVLEIRILRKAGWSFNRLVKKFGVSRSTIRAVCSGKTWKHVEGSITAPKPRIKKTREQVMDIRVRLRNGEGPSVLADEYGMTTTSICYIGSGKLYPQYPGPLYIGIQKERTFLTEQQKKEVVELRAQGVSVKEIAARFGISIAYVYKILREDKRKKASSSKSLLLLTLGLAAASLQGGFDEAEDASK